MEGFSLHNQKDHRSINEKRFSCMIVASVRMALRVSGLRVALFWEFCEVAFNRIEFETSVLESIDSLQPLYLATHKNKKTWDEWRKLLDEKSIRNKLAPYVDMVYDIKNENFTWIEGRAAAEQKIEVICDAFALALVTKDKLLEKFFDA